MTSRRRVSPKQSVVSAARSSPSTSSWNKVPDAIVMIILSFVDGNWLLAHGTTINKHMCHVIQTGSFFSSLSVSHYNAAAAVLASSNPTRMLHLQTLKLTASKLEVEAMTAILSRCGSLLRNLSVKHCIEASLKGFTNLVSIHNGRAGTYGYLKPILHQLEYYAHSDQFSADGGNNFGQEWFVPPPNVKTLIVPLDIVSSVPLSIEHLFVRGGCVWASPHASLSNLTELYSNIDSELAERSFTILSYACVPDKLTRLQLYIGSVRKEPMTMPKCIPSLMIGLRSLHIEFMQEPPASVVLPPLPILNELNVCMINDDDRSNNGISFPATRCGLFLSSKRPGYPKLKYLKVHGLPLHIAPDDDVYFVACTLFPQLETCVLLDGDDTIRNSGRTVSHIMANCKQLYYNASRTVSILLSFARQPVQHFTCDEEYLHSLLTYSLFSSYLNATFTALR